MRELRVLSGLSFGYEVPSFEIKEGMKLDPDIIVKQGTSTDIGPYYLGTGNACACPIIEH